jgi:cytochrome c biogenesis protein ResB
MGALYRFFRSVRLAVVLLLVITVLSLLSTLIPQGREAAFYRHSYPPALASLVTALGFTNFFKSWLFVVPCGLFCLNLAVCSVDRIAGRLRRKTRRRFGPDLVHVGLLVLVVGALLSTAGRKEDMYYLGAGDSCNLPMGYSLRLLDYVFERYEDGRPRDWISTVEASRRGRVVVPSFPIEVNRPLRLRGLKIYQSAFTRLDTALLRNPEGKLAAIHNAEAFRWQNSLLAFAGIEEGRAVFERWEGHTLAEQLRLQASQPVGPYTIVELSSRELTGLRAVKDPGFGPVIAALVLVAGGLALTFIQKNRDKEAA